jgi:hypothetical protein
MIVMKQAPQHPERKEARMTKKSRPDDCKRSVAWPPFEETLARSLGSLEEDQCLIVSVKRSNRYVQFAGQGSYGLRVETISNHYLEKSEKLDRKQRAKLSRMGWNEPTGKPKEATPENDPDGSPNYFFEFSPPVQFDQAAKLAVATLADILKVPHPGMLEYEAFDAEGQPISIPGLGLGRAKRADDAQCANGTAAQLLETLQKETGIAELHIDQDGDIGVRYGSVLILARVVGEPPFIQIFSPLVTEIESSERLFEKLNTINQGSNLLRYAWHLGAVYGVAEIPAARFVGDNVTQTLRQFCRVADDMDDLLQAEFGGRMMFGTEMPSTLRH